jgi:phage-related protein
MKWNICFPAERLEDISAAKQFKEINQHLSVNHKSLNLNFGFEPNQVYNSATPPNLLRASMV